MVGLTIIVSSSCHHLDDTRIPPMPVHIEFRSQAEWDIYGAPAALDYQYFIRENRVPSNFPYSASTFTGYGGVLLVGDVLGNPHAYDLSCPVECKTTVRVRINEDFKAECPQCHSQYDVFSLNGNPVSGPAAQNGWGLRRYSVMPRTSGAWEITY